MKRTTPIILVLVAAGVLGASSFGIYRIGMQRGMAMAAPATVMPQASGNDRKILYWQDPMVPGQKFDKPGKSPFMDMPLVPVYAGAENDGGGIRISSRMQQNLGIRTAEVTKGSLSPAVEAVGNIAYNERDVALVQARSNGYVEKLYVRAPLDAVKKGQPLAELYVPEWVAAQEEYLSIRRMDGGTGGLLEAARQRMRLAGMTDEQIRLIASSGKTHLRLSVTAPISGVITELNAREGMTVANGAPLFRINGLRTVWVNAEVPENFAALVHLGSAVTARTPALPGKLFEGKVGAILPEIDSVTRTIKARIELANPSNELVPGMFATVNLHPAARNDVLLVPSEAVIRTGKRSIVIVEQSQGQFRPVEVEPGAEAGGQIEIRKGLKAGEKVVASGQFLIDSEASLKGVEARMEGPATDDATKNAAVTATHHGVGKVEKIDNDEITISHGPIPSLQWGAMTMSFRLPATGLPASIAVGDSVEFDIHSTADGAFQIVHIAPAVHVPAAEEAHMHHAGAAK